MGALYLRQEVWIKAEEFLKKALEMDSAYAPALENLVAVYASQKDKQKLSGLWSQVEPLLPRIKPEEQSTYSSILFNFGTAYALMGKDWLKQAQEFYEKSLELDNDNWDTRIHWARILAITEEFPKAAQLLIGYESLVSAGESFFGEFPFRDFQVYFCRAGIQAIKGDLKEAEQSAILAGKTNCNPDETRNLQTHLYNLKQENPNTEELHGQILESIRKMEFTFRVGKALNKKSITFRENDFVGYHGTIDTYVDDFKDGIKPKKSKIRQFKGEGFYIAPDRKIACYFAMKKQKDEGRGTPIILHVYASKSLVGNNTVTNKRERNYYDFFHASIDGFENFSQFYVQETSLNKLTLAKDYESVDWTEDDYKKFMNSWTRTRCI
jgi:tetratricopeptide (TPR) repeat protein